LVELRHLRYFVAVAEELNFRRAAERLFISAPTLSQQIKVLEREIGAPLLIRRSDGVELTRAGEVLLRAAGEVLLAAGEALLQTRCAAGVTEPVLRLGLLNGVPGWLPARIEELVRAQLPESRMVMTGGATADQIRLLEGGQVDLALLRAPVSLPVGLRQVRAAEEELGVLMWGADPLAAEDEIKIADLAGRELMLFPRERAPEFHESLLQALRSRGGEVVLSDSATGHAQLPSALALRRDAISLSSARAAGAPGLAWRSFRGRPLTVTYAAAWRSDSRSPTLAPVVGALSRGLLGPPDQER
jgi:DNA-binding transcriptional LysR family regulator